MQLRQAKHTSDLEKITAFYTRVLGLEILGEFRDHEGYDGVFLGHKNAQWHLEFTTSSEPPRHKPDEDDLLVFYPESIAEYNALQQRLLQNGILRQVAKNPYWNENGFCFLDPDGFLLVISPNRIINEERS